MARDINERLRQLATRRKGTDRIDKIASDAAIATLAKSLVTESWERRAAAQPHTRYALGAMQPVVGDYTRIGIETAERIGRQLKTGFAALSKSLDFRLQGSVPLDVHVRGVSDVDLLVLDDDYLTYSTLGVGSRAGLYGSGATTNSVHELSALRSEAEKILKSAYPAAKVDCSGGKCIALSGGSLARPVDVVPSHWHDNVEYQMSRQEHDRTVRILNKRVPTTIDNLPFLHIKRVNDRDTACLGSLKKAIRLTKNVKNDADFSDARKLPSFDIAALLYHADQAALRNGFVHELAILQEAQRFFDWCYHNPTAAKALRTPDGIRGVIDTEEKMLGLRAISYELDALAKEVAREQLKLMTELTRSQIDEALRKATIPAAA